MPSRVLVVDDEPREAIPIISALGSIGVGCIYIRGDEAEKLPKKPFEGIRLVFLDMQLGVGGSQRDVLSKTWGVFRQCVKPDTAPVVVVCWTRHQEHVVAFRRMAVKAAPSLKEAFIVPMLKPLGAKPEAWRVPLNRIRKLLKDYHACDLIWQWENVLHRAATDTSQEIADASSTLARPNRSAGKWQDATFAVCRELVRADAGQTADRLSAPASLFRVMSEMTLDRIGRSVVGSPLAYAKRLVPTKDSPLALDRAARLRAPNRMTAGGTSSRSGSSPRRGMLRG